MQSLCKERDSETNSHDDDQGKLEHFAGPDGVARCFEPSDSEEEPVET